MSVQKYVVKKEEGKFTVLSNYVLQNLKNYEALGLYCYIASLPHNWQFHKTHLSQHAGIGREKIEKLLRILSDHNLIKVIQVRDEKGRFVHADLQVFDGSEFKINNIEKSPHTENPYTEKPLTVNQQLDNSTYKRNTDKTNKDTKERIIKNKESDSKNEIELPNWIDKELWEEFREHRKQIKKPLTKSSEMKAIEKLTKLKNEGQNVQNIINESIINGWSGLFPIQQSKNKSVKNQIKETDHHLDMGAEAILGINRRKDMIVINEKGV